MHQYLASPEIFPQFVRQYCVDITRASIDSLSQLMPTLVLSHRLQRAASSRRRDFIAGRYCARQALRQVAPALSDLPITMSVFGEPQWPAGIAGSITHTGGFVAAAVACRRDALELGLDAERFMPDTVAREVSEIVATAEERARVERRSGLSFGEIITLIYSAKEALFKCLFPLSGSYFDFLDIEIVEVALPMRVFHARLLTGISPLLRPGFKLSGRFDVAYGCVHTGVVLDSIRGKPRDPHPLISR
jgi:enterobactin synthetase component D